MPDLSGLVEALRQGLSEIPPIAITLALLAGPTAAFVGYRLFHAARRFQSSDEAKAAPYWVCPDCRSVNQLRHTHCYHCHQERDMQPDLEVIVEQPSRAPGFFEAPAGSPFAALGQAASTIEPSPGVPVMAPTSHPVAVGPGRTANDSVAISPLEAVIPSSTDELAPAPQPQT